MNDNVELGKCHKGRWKGKFTGTGRARQESEQTGGHRQKRPTARQKLSLSLEKKLRQKSNVDLKFWINILLSPFGSAK